MGTSRTRWAVCCGLSLGMVLAVSGISRAQVKAAPNNKVPVVGAERKAAVTLNDQVAALQEEIGVLQRRIEAMNNLLETQLDRNTVLERQYDELSSKLESLGTSDGENYFPNLLGNMQRSEKFRDEVKQAMQGRLSFDNTTGSIQRVFVNGALWEVIPGRSFTMVPYGRVTLHVSHVDGTMSEPVDRDDWQFEKNQWVLRVPLALSSGVAIP